MDGCPMYAIICIFVRYFSFQSVKLQKCLFSDIVEPDENRPEKVKDDQVLT